MTAEEQQQSTIDEATGDVEKLGVSDAQGAVGRAEDETSAEATAAANASALEHNIASKGKNAYYYAHDKQKQTHVFKWDGKPEPALISREKSNDDLPKKFMKASSFHYAKSNITSYAFLNEDKAVKLYISMEQVDDKCTDADVQLDWDESSMSLTVKNYKDEDQCLSFGKLTANIVDAKFKIKKDKIIVTLKKEKEGVEWHTINDKGAPDHEVV